MAAMEQLTSHVQTALDEQSPVLSPFVKKLVALSEGKH